MAIRNFAIEIRLNFLCRNRPQTTVNSRLQFGLQTCYSLVRDKNTENSIDFSLLKVQTEKVLNLFLCLIIQIPQNSHSMMPKKRGWLCTHPLILIRTPIRLPQLWFFGMNYHQIILLIPGQFCSNKQKTPQGFPGIPPELS